MQGVASARGRASRGRRRARARHTRGAVRSCQCTLPAASSMAEQTHGGGAAGARRGATPGSGARRELGDGHLVALREAAAELLAAGSTSPTSTSSERARGESKQHRRHLGVRAGAAPVSPGGPALTSPAVLPVAPSPLAGDPPSLSSLPATQRPPPVDTRSPGLPSHEPTPLGVPRVYSGGPGVPFAAGGREGVLTSASDAADIESDLATIEASTAAQDRSRTNEVSDDASIPLLERESQAAMRSASWRGERVALPALTSPAGRIPGAAAPSDYIALLPLSDQRLQPWERQRRTRIAFVVAAVMFALATVCVYVLVPRDVSVSLVRPIDATLQFNASARGGWELQVRPVFSVQNPGFFRSSISADVQVRYLRSPAGNMSFTGTAKAGHSTLTPNAAINQTFLPQEAGVIKLIALYAAQCDYAEQVLFILRCVSRPAFLCSCPHSDAHPTHAQTAGRWFHIYHPR